MKLEKKDWEKVKMEAEGMLKQALLMMEVNTIVLQTAERAIAMCEQVERREAA